MSCLSLDIFALRLRTSCSIVVSRLVASRPGVPSFKWGILSRKFAFPTRLPSLFARVSHGSNQFAIRTQFANGQKAVHNRPCEFTRICQCSTKVGALSCDKRDQQTWPPTRFSFVTRAECHENGSSSLPGYVISLVNCSRIAEKNAASLKTTSIDRIGRQPY